MIELVNDLEAETEEDYETASKSDAELINDLATDVDAKHADMELVNDLVTEEVITTEAMLALDVLTESDIVEIPDENLKAVLVESYDTDGDGEMSVSEMETVTTLSKINSGIEDLTGLEYASNLSSLNMSRIH